MNRKRKAFMLTMLLLAGLTAGSSCRRAGPRDIRVLSYNIHHGEGTDGEFDLERLAAVIRRLHPDLVALQEVDSCTGRSSGVDQAALLGTLTGMHAVFGKAMDYDGGGYGEAVLSRSAFAQITPHILPAAPDHEPRCALAVRVRIAGQPLLFIGTHLDHTHGDEDRVRQAHTINRIFADERLPMILAGDMNDVPGGPSNLVYMEMWKDAAAADPSPTFPSSGPERRIDYVFYYPENAWKVIKSEVINEPAASDHSPLLTVLRSEGGNE